MNTITIRFISLLIFAQCAFAVVTPYNEADVMLAYAPLEISIQNAEKINKGEALKTAANEWLQDSQNIIDNSSRETMRSDLLAILYEIGDPISLAFADVFVPSSTSSLNRPHEPTAEEYALAVVFQLPSAKDMEVMAFATMDDHIANLQSRAITRAISLRKELGLMEMSPPYDYWKSFPRDREGAINWVLKLISEAPNKLELSKRLSKNYDLLLSISAKEHNVSPKSVIQTSDKKSLREPQVTEVNVISAMKSEPTLSQSRSIIVVLL